MRIIIKSKAVPAAAANGERQRSAGLRRCLPVQGISVLSPQLLVFIHLIGVAGALVNHELQHSTGTQQLSPGIRQWLKR